MILLAASTDASDSIAGSVMIARRSAIKPYRVMAKVPGSGMDWMAARGAAADV